MRYFLLLTLLLFSANIFAQEMLIHLQSILVKKNESAKSKAFTKATPLSLPFYDDFSNDTEPNPKNWLPSAVLINQTYAINPPTIGVATFDAIGSDGKIYSHLTTDPQKSDSLTSQPINLSTFVADDSLYLSFQYQPKGLGDEPETTDSLVVYFFAKNDNQWVKAWAVSASFKSNKLTEVNHLEKTTKIISSSSIDSSFFCTMIPIKETRFLRDTFQFKIVNYASLSSNAQHPSILGNCDLWHIDLVYININREINDTTIGDIAYIKPLKSILKNYESIPWRHMNSIARNNELSNPLEFKTQIRSFYSSNTSFTRKYFITDISSQTPNQIIEGTGSIDAFQAIDFSWFFEYTFNSSWIDSAKFQLDSRIIPIDNVADYLIKNDSLSYTQKFYNYYAYDDGSAELGYGVWGIGTQSGMIALKYHSYEIDSLKGILIYFNETPGFVGYNFDLVVWNDNNGKPGTQLYKKLEKKPLYTYNADTLYKIDAKLKLGGDFWIGTINTTEDALNIGFDLNNINNSKLFYNITGDWQQSYEKGSLMMKPVFGKFTSWQTGVDIPVAESKFSLYPNPAKNFIRINLPEGVKPEWVRIINLSGQIIMSKPYDSNSIDVSTLQTGIYLFQLTQNNKTTSTQKLVIIR